MMKTAGISSALGLLLALGAGPALEPQALKAEWTFAEGQATTAADSSGNGATGTLANGATWTMGKIGTAVFLDGVNDAVVLPANLSAAQNVSAATVTAWINLSSLPASGAFREVVSLSVNAGAPTNSSRIALAVKGDGTGADLFAGGRSTDIEAQQTATATTANIPIGSWTHVTAVYDFVGDRLKIYRNGLLLVDQAVAFSALSTPNTPSTSSALGAQDAGSGNNFHGALDTVRIWSRALSTSEIERLATGDGLRAQWKLDEGASTTASDSSFENFTGTLVGGPVWSTGQQASALSFDGLDDHVSIGSNISLLRNVNATTVTAWVKPASTIPAGSFRELVSISVNAGAPTAVSRVALALKGDGTAGDLFAGGRSTDTETQKSLTDNSSLNVGEYVHVAGVIDFAARTITLYKNGTQTATGAAPFVQTHTPNTVSTSASLGTQDNASGNFYQGDLDDVRVYARALSSQEVRDLVMKDCLMAHWKFDEATGTLASDASGNGVTGTLANGATWGTGQFGSAASLDGTDDAVLLPANLTMLRKTPAATLAGWVKLSSLPATGAFRELISISVGAASPTNTSRAALALKGDGAAADIFAGGRSSDTEAQQTLTADANIGVGVFTHVAAVISFAGDSIKIYVNGQLAASALVNFSQLTTADTDSRNGALGAQDTGVGNPFAGLLDELRIYCRELTSAEIQALATVAVPPAPTNPAAVAGDTTITLTWTASPGATSYNVYRRLLAGTYGAPIANTTQTTYVDMGLTNGTEYFYRVKAVNAAGESADFSSEDSATPNPTGTPPAKPVITTASQTTNDTTPDIVGTSEASASIAVFITQGATTVQTLTTTANFMGQWSVTAAPLADGTYTVKARASNAAGISPDSDPITIVVDTVAPAIANVTSATANGAYAAGAVIDVTVNFTEPVTLAGGNLLVTLNTGVTVSIPAFATPASSASGTYTVQAGHNSPDLTATSPLALSAGATLRDAAGLDAVLTIPGGGNLGDLKNIVIDTLPPAVDRVTSTTADGSYGVGASINITVIFFEAVTLSSGNLLVTLDTGAVVSIAPFGPANSAGGTYAVAAGQNSPDLTAVSPLALQGGAILRDAAGNAAILSIPANFNLGDLKSIVIDTVAPTVTSVTSTTADGTYGIGASINLTVNFSEAVTLSTGNLLVNLNTGATVSIAPFGPANTASGAYLVGAGQNTPDLTAASPLALQAGASLRDTAGNPALLSIPANFNLGDLKAIAISTPPLPPTNLAAVAGNSRVDLSWTAPAGGANAYNVFRSADPAALLADFSVIATGVAPTSYADTTAVNTTTYRYYVTALNGVGESGPSNVVTATPLPPAVPPPAPTNLRVTTYFDCIDVDWDEVPGVLGYNVYRRPASGTDFTKLNTQGLVRKTKYRDSRALDPQNGPAAGVTYSYRVTAVRAP